MKRLITLLLFGWIISAPTLYAQDIDLTKLPKEEREKLLFEIATEAMQKYAPSYLRKDIRPIIGYEGPVTTDETDKDFGRQMYRVDFPFNVNKDTKEGDDNMYGGTVGIYATTGKVFSIRPNGWYFFDIEAADAGTGNKVAQPGKIPRLPDFDRILTVNRDSLRRNHDNFKRTYLEQKRREREENRDKQEPLKTKY